MIKIRKKIITISIAIAMLANLFLIQPIHGAVEELPITITRTVTPAGEIFAGEEVTIRYTITPGDIAVTPQPAKEIVIVLDKSGSMGWDVSGKRYGVANEDERITIAKKAAIKFINKFAGKSNIKIAFVTYNSSAYNNKSFMTMSNASDVTALIDSVNGISAGGGTNIGAGIKKADGILKAGSSTADKFMVFLTDGEPTSSSNSKTPLEYAKYWAGEIDNGANPINGYYIAFSNAGANKLKVISNETKDAYYKVALTENDLDAVYTEIADKIDSYSPINDMYFEETLPKGMVYLEVPAGFEKSGLVANYNIPPIEYELNATKTFYEADTIIFELKVKAEKQGAFYLGSGKSFITYTDIDEITTRKKEFSTVPLNIFSVNAPTIEMSQEWNSQDRVFTLKPTGTGGMHFVGESNNTKGDYISFTGKWADKFLGNSQDSFTIRTILKPDNLTGEHSNHGTKNVFFAKASDAKNDNIEIGIDKDTNNLILYLDTKNKNMVGADTTRIIGNGELKPDAYHEVIVTYDKGKITVFLDGNKYTDSTWNGSTYLDQADTSPITIGGTLHIDTFFDGSISLVELYDDSVYLEDIYNGTATGLIGSYNGLGNIANQLKDDSGSGHDSSLVKGVTLQEDASGSVQLQYKIGEKGSWTNYILGKSIIALDEPGEVKIYARAIYSKGGKNHTSTEVYRVARVTERGYIDEIELIPDKTEVTVGESVTISYVFSGSSVQITNQTEKTIKLENVSVTIDIPDGLNVVDLPANFEKNGGVITGTISGNMIRQANGEYKFDGATLDIIYEPQTTTDVVIPVNSVTVDYTDYYNNDVSYKDGNKVDLNILPTMPTIATVAGDDIVDQTEMTAVIIEGTADPGVTVTIVITGPNKTITVTAVADANGNYQTLPQDFSGFTVNEDIQVDASVTDGDGDKVNAEQRTVQRQLVVPDIDSL